MTNDVPFKDAHLRFDNAIHDLIGMRWTVVHRCDGTNHRPDCQCAGTTKAWQPSLYTQIREELEGLSGPAGKGKAESRPPLWVDGADWLTIVDRAVERWTPNTEGGTVARLDELSRHGFGPDDTSWLEKATKSVVSWVAAGNTLLEGEEVRRFDVVAPCPQCGVQTVRRKDSGGDWVRQTALQLTIHGCTCQACGTWWDHEHLNFLAEVIGCERKELA
ncbi:DUF7341 domain-containing protein [Gordonia amicalis]|uniref:DUF7341 domain-containing protein n=1 Tax=Gordonia amicalis TaxID=89053 RepID=UPI0024BBAA4D|nr:hypothetical protein [Gordonia amicalis]MDJ0454399.1 hypothetical protein [Gordonia amicalis]MDV7077712.1 hypothetical protein [Gordonia amicalis]